MQEDNKTKGSESWKTKVVDSFTVINKLLGEGQFGKVYIAIQTTDKSQKYAAKAIDITKMKDPKQLELLVRECEVLKNLSKENNQHIIQLYSYKRTASNLYMFFELCTDGDLEQFMKKQKKGISEEESVSFLRHIIDGFKVLQSQSVIHRDIKPANILLKNGIAKISDFGFSRYIQATQLNEPQVLTRSGTPLYMAPQLLCGQEFSSKCDVWSIGIMLYQMLYGMTPWNGSSQIQLYNNIKNNPLNFPEKPHKSNEIKQLIKQMLQFDEEKRISFQEIFQHKIINDKNYLIQSQQKPVTQNNFSTQASLSTEYFENNKATSYLNELEEWDEVPEEKAPALSISQSCYSNAQLNVQQQEQMNDLNKFLQHNRNILMFFSKVASQLYANSDLIANRLLENDQFFKMLLVQTKRVVNNLKEVEGLFTGIVPAQMFSTSIWQHYKNTTEHYKIEQIIYQDALNIQQFSQEIIKKFSEVVTKQDSEYSVYTSILTEQMDDNQFKTLVAKQINNLISKVKPNLTQVDRKILSLIKCLVISVNNLKEFGSYKTNYDFKLFYEQLNNEELSNLQDQCKTITV